MFEKHIEIVKDLNSRTVIDINYANMEQTSDDLFKELKNILLKEFATLQNMMIWWGLLFCAYLLCLVNLLILTVFYYSFNFNSYWNKNIHIFIYHFINNTTPIIDSSLFIFPISTSHPSTKLSSPFSASNCPPSVSGTPRKSTPYSADHSASPALTSISSSPLPSMDLTEFARSGPMRKSFSAHSANLATVFEDFRSAPSRSWSFDAALRPRTGSKPEMMACTLGLSGNCLVFGYCRFRLDSSRMLKERWFIFTFRILGRILERSQFDFEVDHCFHKVFHWIGRPLRSWGHQWLTCWHA